jgi:23S rRNA pseudouridine1911/1915/1917 synthase
VPAELSGAGLLEAVAAHLVNESKTRLRRLIGSGLIRLNGSAVTPRTAVRQGDVISLPAGLRAGALPTQVVPIDVLYEDDEMLCVSKPAGYPVLPGRTGEGAEFFRSLVALVNRASPPGGPYVRPHVVHRLDRETSGVLLVAKSVEAGRALSRQFERRLVEKAYVGIVEGVLPRPEVTVDVPLRRKRGSVLQMEPAPRRGKPAVTLLRMRERLGHFCLLDIRPLTGRQHQIRVHLAAIGYPLAVDGLYGRRDRLEGAELNAILRRPAAPPRQVLLGRCPLHAASIRYRHPRNGEEMAHEAPLPAEMEGFLQLLRAADPPAPLR